MFILPWAIGLCAYGCSAPRLSWGKPYQFGKKKGFMSYKLSRPFTPFNVVDIRLVARLIEHNESCNVIEIVELIALLCLLWRKWL